jgi:hypothetical protein
MQLDAKKLLILVPRPLLVLKSTSTYLRLKATSTCAKMDGRLKRKFFLELRHGSISLE